MPSVAGTIRPKLDDKELLSKFPVAPVSIAQFFGEAARDIDVNLRAKKGSFLSHWPPAAERSGRLQWFKSDLSPTPPAGIPQSYLPETHWFHKLRGMDSALYLKPETGYERFIAYDAEVAIKVPVKLRGGPDEYTLQNLTERRLLDVCVIAPTENGFRVGWLDELPAATPESELESKKKKAKDKEETAKKTTEKQKAEAVFKDAEAKPKEEEKPTPLPPEADATVKARIDQILNRPVNVTVQQTSRKDVLDLVVGQARIRYELDDKTIAKEQINLGSPMTLQAPNIAARDALAEILGGISLSYRVTADGTLYITTAARLTEDADKKGTVVEGPPIKLTLSQPLKPSNPSYRELTRDTYARRLGGQGLRESVIQLVLDQYSASLFEPGELIVLAHLSRDSLDEAVLLDVFPPPKKLIRTALIVCHGIDPRLQDRARTLVQELGDKSPKKREAAEAKLLEMGPVAVPVLEDVLAGKDVEIVYRAERILLKLNRPVP